MVDSPSINPREGDTRSSIVTVCHGHGERLHDDDDDEDQDRPIRSSGRRLFVFRMVSVAVVHLTDSKRVWLADDGWGCRLFLAARMF